MKRIAVLTSGGDAPGMNAAIRAVVRSATAKGIEVMGVKLGYSGLIAGSFIPIGTRDVGGIIQRGGTVLGSARCPEFRTEDGRLKALHNVNQEGIEGLIIIGGNGSQTGAEAFSQLDFPVVGIASTIDNDLYGSEMTIGVDTAVNIALEAIDRLKVTASSHQRAFLLEVMGRECGYLALMSGLAGGAEKILIPEVETDPEEVATSIRKSYERGKPHAIVVVAEGCKYNADKLSTYFLQHQERLGFELRVTILGHTQRGGTPSAFDRILASRLGAAAVECMANREYGVLVGLQKSDIVSTTLAEVVGKKKVLDPRIIELARILD